MSAVTCPSCFHTTPVLSREPGAAVTCLRCRAPIPPELLALDEPRPEGEEAAPAAEPAGYEATPYTGTPGGSPAGFVVTLAVGLVGAAVIGFAMAFLRQYFWFVLILAIAMGMAVGGITGLGAKLGKYRVKEGAVLAGAISGFAAGFLLHYFGYLLLTWDIPALKLVTFWEFMDAACQAGATIGSSINLGYTGSAIYWGLEVLVIVIASAAAATWPVSRPFCAGCNEWKEKRPLGTFRIDAPRAVQAVAAGRPSAVVTPADADDRVAVSVYSCPGCGSAGGVEVEVAGTRGKGEGAVTMTVCMSYPGEAVADFEAARARCLQQGLETK